jgi:hypothetical protein
VAMGRGIADTRRPPQSFREHRRPLTCCSRGIWRPDPIALGVWNIRRSVTTHLLFELFFELFERIRGQWRRGDRPLEVRSICRTSLAFVHAWSHRIEAFLMGRPRTLASAKWGTIRIVHIRILRPRWRLGLRLRLLLAPRLLHLLPCRGEVRSRLRVGLPGPLLLCRRRRPEVPARKAVCSIRVRRILLRRGRTLRGGSRRRRAVVWVAARRRVRLSVRRRWPSSRCIWARLGYIEAAELPAVLVVLCPLCRVAQNLMRRLNLLELGDELGFTSWVAVGMIP